ncbi:S-layer homology domain-containing protein|uniref:S-layer homology domain-containing protein n=1 Tax=Dendrosporobacter quercicolus TaxID=146817 RepID=A0A1G9WL21_9FIRM|nr:S-layer homology domain-containing protein [Dendrosporobacter quercicolus]NSL49144.1 S-layer homology domain-containing protein [Dendrosporobacter quercicolus DSM 1736]SDM85292.1 S-layer homology domain-containing protein [Dendrosporobacter quercicolus]
MKKRLLKVAVTTALTVAFAVPAFAASANPFSDVPANHWAYDAVNKLAQAGVVDGYADGTFKGDKTMTRYEMAQIVAKAMNKSLNDDQQGTVDELSQEFAAELNNLGVKVDSLQEQVDDMVKVSGDARVRYFAAEDAGDNTDFRARVNFDGKISDNLKFNARLTSGNMNYDGGNGDAGINTANVTFDALGLTNTIGRQDVILAEGYLFDTQMNAVATEIGGLKLVAGNTDANRIYAAEYGFNALGTDLVADYYKNDTADQEIYGLSTGFKLTKNLAINASYYDNNDADATAVSYGVKLNKLGLSATYRDVEAGAYTGFGALANDQQPSTLESGFKGMEYAYDRALDRNTALNVKYQDFEDQDGIDLGARTQATVSVKF